MTTIPTLTISIPTKAHTPTYDELQRVRGVGRLVGRVHRGHLRLIGASSGAGYRDLRFDVMPGAPPDLGRQIVELLTRLGYGAAHVQDATLPL